MDLLNDDALSKITGHGFSSFSVTHENGLNIARMNPDIRATTFTETEMIPEDVYRVIAPGIDQALNFKRIGFRQEISFEALRSQKPISVKWPRPLHA